MIRTFIASFCLLTLTQAAQAEDNGKSHLGERFAWSSGSLHDTPYNSQNSGGGYGHGPRGELVGLGERLFFDPSLSGSGQTACATCHDPSHGWAEPRPTSIFDTGRRGSRNASSIINVAYAPVIMWDGRFRALEEQALFPFRRFGEMGADIHEVVERLREDPSYRGQFEAVLGQRPTAHGVGRAIAAFERAIVSSDSPFDRFWRDHDHHALNPLERDGYEIFTGKGGCVNCHDISRDRREQPLFSDFAFHNEGVGFRYGRFRDFGRARITHRQHDIGAFRTPPLRNVALTPPYMHDGSLPTLEAVVEFYNAGGQDNPDLDPQLQPLDLSHHEKEALVAFLYALTDPRFRRNDYPRSFKD